MASIYTTAYDANPEEKHRFVPQARVTEVGGDYGEFVTLLMSRDEMWAEPNTRRVHRCQPMF